MAKATEKVTTETIGPKKLLAKTVQLGLGLDLLGSKTSLQGRASGVPELEVTAVGVKATSAKGRIVIIPFANIKGIELFSEPTK